MTERVTVGMVGLGGWGKNLLRNFAALPDADLRWACDADEGRRAAYQAAYPATQFTADLEDVLSDPEVDAVVLATPVPTHHALARRAMEAGKHVMVEKPMAWSVEQARDLRDLAAETGRVLMVGHLLRFHPGVVKLRELIDSGELGEVRYVYGNRQNLGVIREDENALWSLGVHDISVVLHLLDGRPVEVSARGECYVRPSVEDVVFGYVKFATGQIGHLHLSWLDPHKMRKMTVVGSTQDGRVRRHGARPQGHGLRQGPDPCTRAGGDQHAHRRHPHPRVSRERAAADRVPGASWRPCARAMPSRARAPTRALAVVEVLEAMQRSLEQGGGRRSLEAARA